MRTLAIMGLVLAGLTVASACGGGSERLSIPANLSPSETVRTFLQLKIEGRDEEAVAQLVSSRCTSEMFSGELFTESTGVSGGLAAGEGDIDLSASEFEEEIGQADAAVQARLRYGPFVAVLSYHLVRDDEQWRLCEWAFVEFQLPPEE